MDIETACESTKAKQYAANGNYQDWLIHCAQNKLTPERILDVRTEEWMALIAESNNRFRPDGDSDGDF